MHLKSNKSHIGFWKQASDSKTRFSNRKQQLTIDPKGWNDAKHIKQISTTGRLNAKRLRAKQQIHTIRHKCLHEGKSAAITKKWQGNGDLRHLSMRNKDCSRFSQKWLSEKVGFQKAVKIPVFCYFQPQICIVSFLVDNYTQKHTQRLKTLKTPKTAVYKV